MTQDIKKTESAALDLYLDSIHDAVGVIRDMSPHAIHQSMEDAGLNKGAVDDGLTGWLFQTIGAIAGALVLKIGVDATIATVADGSSLHRDKINPQLVRAVDFARSEMALVCSSDYAKANAVIRILLEMMMGAMTSIGLLTPGPS